MGGEFPGFPSEPDFEDGGSPSEPVVPPVVKRVEPVKKFEAKPLLQYQGRTIVRDQGRIAYLMLPNKFELHETRETDFCKRYEYKIPRYDSMMIAHWDWNNPNSQFSESVGAGFMAVLNMEPHVLSDEEIEIAEEVIPVELYGHNSNYDLTGLRTENYGGMNCLVLETKWWDADLKAAGLFFPSDQSGRFIESLHFEGTDFDYRKTFLSAKAAFMRIKWR
jgi:hypothetical protein